jgi:DNA-binding MarR family transcriptional regulator
MVGEISQGDLGQILALDSTTLTRTLEIMGRQGWVAKQQGKDRRAWRLSLTAAGRSQFKRALPGWEEAQSRLKSQLGSSDWEKVMSLTNIVTSAVTDSGEGA